MSLHRGEVMVSHHLSRGLAQLAAAVAAGLQQEIVMALLVALAAVEALRG